jgi:predicted small secreted protein
MTLEPYPNNIHHKGEHMFRTLTALLVVAFFASACNTMAGAGQDIERGGEKIQGAAERNK